MLTTTILTTVLITFILLLVIISAMAIGYIFKKKSLQGSCGGMSALGIKRVCDCPEPCAKRKAQMAAEQNKHNQSA